MVTAEHIRAARAALNESQSAFGDRFGVDQCTISRWERRGPPAQGFVQTGIAVVLDALRRDFPEAFASAAEIGEGGGEGGGQEGSGHAPKVADDTAAVTANDAGGFA